MDLLAPGSLINQTHLTSTSDTDAIVAAKLHIELTRVEICNVTGSAVTYRIYHDNTAAGYGIANALRYDVSLPANSAHSIVAEIGSGIILSPGAKLGVKAGTANAVTFSFYGVTRPAR